MNTLKTQAKTNKMITAYLALNNVTVTATNDNGVLVGKVLLQSVIDAKKFVSYVNNF